MASSRGFYGHVEHCRAGRVELSRVVSSQEWSRRTPSHVRQDEQDTYVLVHVRQGAIALRHGSHEFDLGPNSFAFYCASRPYEWHHRDFTEVGNIAIPGPLLRAWLRNVDHFTARPFQRSSAPWAVFSDMFDLVFRHIPEVTDPMAYRLAGQLVDLLALSLELGDELSMDGAGSRGAAYLRCVNFIRSNLSDPDLGPDTVAKAVCISTRAVHRLFSENGTSVGDLLREERLQSSLRALQDPAFVHLSIAEIACRQGFRSQAHFANAFKARFGLTARDCRRHGAPDGPG